MELKPIKSEADYNAALERLEIIFDAEPGTPECDELEILGLMVYGGITAKTSGPDSRNWRQKPGFRSFK
jgi:hypothetical protein